MLHSSQNYNYKNKAFYRLDVHTGSWDELDITKATQSYGIILNDQNEIVLSFNSDSQNWLLPGGSIEEGETPIQALVREVYEEAAVVVDETTIQPAFYQHVYELKDEGEEYHALQLRYIARALRIDQFVGDPAGTMTEVKWVTLDTIENYLKWGETLDLIKKVVMEYS